VALSREARQRAEAIEKAAAARNFEGASSEAIKVAETCTACHRLHRPLP
jgi:cytochrome c2